MAEIKVLDDKTINQIAAGEVVERPVSVVKELVENAIDAGAENISVEIKDGGISLIRITDNGSGIEKSSIRTAFLRHATSKINSALDLLTVKSLGFRGEALSSIAAVAQIELLTKTADSMFGIRYCLDGGREMSYDEVGIPDGTTIIVRNLFFNTPARRKFLKSPMTEGNYISELMERMILSHPDISFRYIVNGKEKLSSFGNNDVKHNIYNVFGRDMASLVIPVEYISEGLSIKGFIGKPETSRGNRLFEMFFVNSRFVKSSILSKAVEEAYKNYLMMHKYPFVCLYFDIDLQDIDVNVHPAKTEIRFLKEKELYDAIVSTILDALAEKELIVDILAKDSAFSTVNVAYDSNKGNDSSDEYVRSTTKNDCGLITSIGDEKELSKNDNEIASPKNDAWQNEVTDSEDAEKICDVSFNESNVNAEALRDETLENGSLSGEDDYESDILLSTPEPFETKRIIEQKSQLSSKEDIEVVGQETLFSKEFLKKENIGLHKIVGQVFDTYWIVEFDNKMYIIDQHAAHEKVLYERFKAKIDSQKVNTQLLSPPIIVTLNLSEVDALTKHMDSFNCLGFEVEPFGGRDYAITGVPTDLYGLNEKEYFLEVLDDLALNSKVSDSKSVNDRIATMACKAAIKGNMRFSLEEAKALIDELLSLENPYNCPHGRPTIITYRKQEIEKLFKRIV